MVFFALLGVLFVIGLTTGLVLYVLDVPERSQRLRIETEAQEAAWRIQQHTRAAVEQMLEEARQAQSKGRP